jgi:hypothetical protein
VCRGRSDDFNEKRKEWQTYMRQQKEIKQQEWLERKAARQAEYDAQKKAYEEEQAKRDPWEEEKVICEQLILFCDKYMPKKEEVRGAESPCALVTARHRELPSRARVHCACAGACARERRPCWWVCGCWWVCERAA